MVKGTFVYPGKMYISVSWQKVHFYVMAKGKSVHYGKRYIYVSWQKAYVSLNALVYLMYIISKH